jgi:predicted RND superfamily exporter protein
MKTLRILLERLAASQHSRPATYVVVAAVVAALAFPLMKGLGLNSDWTALLPSNKPSVVDLHRAQGRVGGLATLTLMVESRNVDAMQRFARALVPRLERLRGDQTKVRSVDWNIAAFEDFVTEHRYLYASRQDLTEIRDALQERIDYEHAQANPLFVSLDDEVPPEPREVIERIETRAREGRSKMRRFPGGFYVHPDGNLLAIFIRTDISGGDAAGAGRLISTVQQEVDALRPSSFAADLKVEYAGDLLVGREEHDAIQRELVIATSLTIVLVLLSIYLFFFRVRAIGLLGLTMIPPIVATFAFAKISVEYLNTSTAFLGSIVVGNGINQPIIWMARYFEERRRGNDVASSLRETHVNTFAGTLSASTAAALSYGSLVITDFRGFRDFGIIGGMGMILSWLAMLLLLPALCALLERLRPMTFKAGKQHGSFYGKLFSKTVFGAPRAVVVVAILLSLGSIGATALAIARDPLEYDFRNLRSVRQTSSRASEGNARVGQIVGRGASGDAIYVLVRHRADAPRFRAEIERLRDREHAPFGRVSSIDDLLPSEQPEKIALLSEIRSLLQNARRFASEADQRNIDANMPPERIETLDEGDLPEAVARPFTEKDGTRGTILAVESREGSTTWDGRYLIAWAQSLRAVRVPGAELPILAGRAPVFADIIEVILVDGPKAVIASLFATLFVILLTFRKSRDRLLTFVSLVFGVIWMTGLMATLGMKLNFLNFVAFPITFGIGVDYAVNVMRRFVLERDSGRAPEDAIRCAIEETGGAVVLCSLTTIIGYLSLWTSANLALNSFGEAMGISELTCLTAAGLVVPAILLLTIRRNAAKTAHASKA